MTGAGQRPAAYRIPDIAAISGISGPQIPALMAPLSANELLSIHFRQHDNHRTRAPRSDTLPLRAGDKTRGRRPERSRGWDLAPHDLKLHLYKNKTQLIGRLRKQVVDPNSSDREHGAALNNLSELLPLFWRLWRDHATRRSIT